MRRYEVIANVRMFDTYSEIIDTGVTANLWYTLA
jgi:hypothetical protein